MAMDLYSRYGASLDRLREQFRAIREDSEKNTNSEQVQSPHVIENNNVIPISAGREKDH